MEYIVNEKDFPEICLHIAQYSLYLKLVFIYRQF